MNRTQKEAFVAKLADGVDKAQALALLSFNKIDVETMTAFRLSLKKRNIDVKVVKNTLAKRVFEKTPYTNILPFLEGPTLLAYGADPVVTAKAVMEWAEKENFDVKVRGGAAMGQPMTDVQLKALSKLPGRNELFVSFLWALKSSPTKFLYALSDAPKKLGYALGALRDLKEKKEKGS